MFSLKRILTRLLAPLFGFNLAALGAAGLWLGSEGQTQVLGLGVIMLVFSPFIIPILLIPAGVFSHFMGIYSATGRRGRERLMLSLSLAYIILFLTLWCTGIFEYVTQSVAVQAIPPGVLWANAAALAPLLWWCSRDANNFFIMLLVVAAQIAMIMLSLVRLLKGESFFWPSFGAFGGFLALVAALRSVYENKFMNRAENAPH